jgi:molecular chaperone IbpA
VRIVKASLKANDQPGAADSSYNRFGKIFTSALETFFGFPDFFAVAEGDLGASIGAQQCDGPRRVSGAGSYPTCSKEDLAMRYDWSPLWRSTIGFDRLFDVFDEVQRTTEDNYPHYNIERLDENRFQISVALAGFSPDQISLTAVLILEGRKTEKDGDRLYLFRGISTRSFKRQFTLADHVEVKSAQFKDGLLVIDLVREVPEAMKPRQIAINSEQPEAPEQIEAKAA